jgi:hypothetical protein
LAQIVARFLLVGGLTLGGVAPLAAEDLQAGKSAASIFASDCSACHRSAQGLARGMGSGALVDFLRQHYTTGGGHAAQVAGYLLSVAGDPRRSRPTASVPAGFPNDPTAGATQPLRPPALVPTGNLGDPPADATQRSRPLALLPAGNPGPTPGATQPSYRPGSPPHRTSARSEPRGNSPKQDDQPGFSAPLP